MCALHVLVIHRSDYDHDDKRRMSKLSMQENAYYYQGIYIGRFNTVLKTIHSVSAIVYILAISVIYLNSFWDKATV